MQQQLLSRVLLLLSCLSCIRSQAAAAVHVGNSAQLLSALKSPADVIVLRNDVAMGEEFHQFEGSPLRIARWDWLL